MAHISGVTAGLVPVAQERPRKPRKAAKPSIPKEAVCDACGGLCVAKRGRPLMNPCYHCTTHFGLNAMGGATSDDPDTAKRKLAAIKEQGWVIILRRGTFSSGGADLTIEPGDVMKVNRVGLPDDEGDISPQVSKERTRDMFSVSIKIGPFELRLWTHEVSAIPFVTIMALRKDGELKDAYVSDNDEHGHFTPTPELREQIYAAFGSLVNAPRDYPDDDEEEEEEEDGDG